MSLLAAAKSWKQPKCLSLGTSWINYDTPQVEQSVAMKRNEEKPYELTGRIPGCAGWGKGRFILVSHETHSLFAFYLLLIIVLFSIQITVNLLFAPPCIVQWKKQVLYILYIKAVYAYTYIIHICTCVYTYVYVHIHVYSMCVCIYVERNQEGNLPKFRDYNSGRWDSKRFLFFYTFQYFLNALY